MPRAELTITIPRDIWIGEISRNFPDTKFRILAAIADEETGVGLAEIIGPDIGSVITDMHSYDMILSIDILQRRDEMALVQFETSMPLLLFPIQGSGTPLEMPFIIKEGQAEWEITAPQEKLSKLGAQLEEFNIPFVVNEIKQEISNEQLLTAKQEDLIKTAVEEGYYDTPREITLTELAELCDMAKSTCSEILHRAEGKIIKEFADNLKDQTQQVLSR
ncbi:MAG: helix-turn-helix domain-containing protein [Halobacteriaceae archaeon]